MDYYIVVYLPDTGTMERIDMYEFIRECLPKNRKGNVTLPFSLFSSP